MFEDIKTLNDLPEVSAEQLAAIQEATGEESAPQPEEAPQKEAPQGENFRKMRIAKAEAERKYEEALKRIQELENKTNSLNALKEGDEEISIDDDAIPEGRDLKKIDKRLGQETKHLKQQYEEAMERIVELQIKTQYPDFDQVVSRENIQSLIETEPEIAHSISSNPDKYKQAVAAYK